MDHSMTITHLQNCDFGSINVIVEKCQIFTKTSSIGNSIG